MTVAVTDVLEWIELRCEACGRKLCEYIRGSLGIRDWCRHCKRMVTFTAKTT